jgi:uncharacterized protein (TIGR02217 family)
MSFIEQRLLDRLAVGTQGGPTWSTRQVALASGIVRRNAQRSRPLYRYAVLYANLLPEHYLPLLYAFNASRGGAFGFRLRDPVDFEALNEAFATGTGVSQTAQLVKSYAWGPQVVARPIRKPNAGVVVTANGTPIAASVDTTTGLATFTAPVGQTVRWSGTFDVPVRFESDQLITSFDRSAQAVILSADVPLVEVLDA